MSWRERLAECLVLGVLYLYAAAFIVYGGALLVIGNFVWLIGPWAITGRSSVTDGLAMIVGGALLAVIVHTLD